MVRTHTPETADAHDAGQSPEELDTVTLFRLVVERLRAISPAGVANPRLVWDIPGNAVPGSLPLVVPAVKLSQLAADILEVLRDGEGWLHGEEIGRLLNPRDPIDYTSGSFKRAMAELTDATPKLVESNTRKGYRANDL